MPKPSTQPATMAPAAVDMAVIQSGTSEILSLPRRSSKGRARYARHHRVARRLSVRLWNLAALQPSQHRGDLIAGNRPGYDLALARTDRLKREAAGKKPARRRHEDVVAAP